MNNFLQLIKLILLVLRNTAIAIIAIILFPLLIAISFSYSYSHPEYEKLQSRINTLNDNEGLNFSDLNSGKWKTACLFGGYTNPSYIMKKHGRISWVDYFYQPMKAWPIIRFAQVEEHEAMIAYVDAKNDVHFIHFEKGLTQTRSLESVKKCTRRNEPILKDLWSVREKLPSTTR